jgi:hypothetical protein
MLTSKYYLLTSQRGFINVKNMSHRTIFRFLSSSAVFFSLFLTASSANASVVTYPAPSGGIPLSSDFSVTADGQRVDVYQVKVPPQYVGYNPCPSRYELASMAYFDFSGTVNVQITSSRAVSSVVVRPLRYGIQPSVNGNTISFSLSQPHNLSIEINGDDRHNLHLFANPPETNVPSPSDPNVMYFGPGVHGNGSQIQIGDGRTVYIAGGAVLYGTIYAYTNDITIRGRGILSGEKTPKGCDNSGVSLVAVRAMNTLNLEGFIALDPPTWTFALWNIGSVYADNVKAIGWRGNGDGMEPMSTSYASIKNVFLRDTDDTLGTKSGPSYWESSMPSNRPSENFDVRDSVTWPDGAGHAFTFMEQALPYARNIHFSNIDVIHSYTPIVYMTCCDTSSASQYNVTFDDIRVEDMKEPNNVFIFNAFNSGNSIHNVYINNFSILGGNTPPSEISGANSSSVYNVTFNNLNYLGRTIMSASDGQFNISGNVSNIQFTSGGSVPTPIPTPTPTPSNPPCNNLWNSSLSVPTGFGASFNWFTSAKELLLQAYCGSAGAYVQAGNGSNLQYIYKTGYIWQNSQWTSFNYSGSSFTSDGNWIIGQASNAFGGLDLTQKQSVLAYICDWDGSQWHCGCHDSTCATNYWNLQQFKQ